MSKTAQAYPFPVLGPDRLDYAPGRAYKTSDWRVGGGMAYLRHQIIGDNLVGNMVAEGRAQFGVAVVMKATMYRRTFIADNNGELSVAQSFPIEKSTRSIELPKLMPMVIYTGDDQNIVAKKDMGLDELWLGQEFPLPRGAILARERDHEFMPSLEHLLQVRPNPDLRPGEIRVGIGTSDGGYFFVQAHPDLYAAMRAAQTASESQRRHLNSILTQALHAGFEKLTQKKQDEEIKTLENFQSVKRRLEDMGIDPWDDEGFDPLKAACAYYPHLFEVKLAEDDHE